MAPDDDPPQEDGHRDDAPPDERDDRRPDAGAVDPDESETPFDEWITPDADAERDTGSGPDEAPTSRDAGGESGPEPGDARTGRDRESDPEPRAESEDAEPEPQPRAELGDAEPKPDPGVGAESGDTGIESDPQPDPGEVDSEPGVGSGPDPEPGPGDPEADPGSSDLESGDAESRGSESEDVESRADPEPRDVDSDAEPEDAGSGTDPGDDGPTRPGDPGARDADEAGGGLWFDHTHGAVTTVLVAGIALVLGGYAAWLLADVVPRVASLLVVGAVSAYGTYARPSARGVVVRGLYGLAVLLLATPMWLSLSQLVLPHGTDGLAGPVETVLSAADLVFLVVFAVLAAIPAGIGVVLEWRR